MFSPDTAYRINREQGTGFAVSVSRTGTGNREFLSELLTEGDWVMNSNLFLMNGNHFFLSEIS